MISLFFNRFFRSINIEPEVFDEVQKDKNAILSAAVVVIISSTATGIAAATIGADKFMLTPIFALINWFIWSYTVYFVGVKLFPEPRTKTTQFALLRAMGFSLAPGIIRIFSFKGDLLFVTFLGSGLWMLACMVVAVKVTLNYKSLLKAFGVVILSFFMQVFIFLSIVGMIIAL